MMKSVGEVMAMGRTWIESFQKALRGMETGLDGWDLPKNYKRLSKEDVSWLAGGGGSHQWVGFEGVLEPMNDGKIDGRRPAERCKARCKAFRESFSMHKNCSVLW